MLCEHQGGEWHTWDMAELAEYDLFQPDNKIKPDYASAQGLEVFDAEDQEWREWDGEDGNDIATVM